MSAPDFTKPPLNFAPRRIQASDIRRMTETVSSIRTVVNAIVEGQQAKAELKRMGNLAGIADRIKAKKEAHSAKADEWAKRLDEVDKREPQAFAVADAAIAEREADIAAMENDLRALSNLPLSGSTTS